MYMAHTCAISQVYVLQNRNYHVFGTTNDDDNDDQFICLLLNKITG